MPDIIILGNGGEAGHNIIGGLGVNNEHVFRIPHNISRNNLQNFRNILPQNINTMHWIGHGNPSSLFLNFHQGGNDNRANATQIANFLDIVIPERVIFWACNTGLRRVGNGTNNQLFDFFNDNNNRVLGNHLDININQFNNHLLESFVFNVANEMNIANVNLYGPTLGIGGGILPIFNAFNGVEGPDQLIHWQSTLNDNPPNTNNPNARKYRKITTLNNNVFHFIFSYENRLLNTVKRCTYLGPYEI